MSSEAKRTSWTVDPDDPRAPPTEIWEALTAEQRRAVLDGLPSEFPVSEAAPPEGNAHFNAKVRAHTTLDDHFRRVGRQVFFAAEMPVYYPGERMFAPDLSAVLDVETYERPWWNVDVEGKGIDLALEIVVSGSRKKDLQGNVQRYARLGIPEYFVFDRGRLRLYGYRLSTKSPRTYEPILAQGGRFSSQVLGLDLRIEGVRLRFYVGASPVLETHEVLVAFERMIEESELRAVLAEQERAAAERAREAAEQARAAAEAVSQEEHARRLEAERDLAAARAELDALKASTKKPT